MDQNRKIKNKRKKNCDITRFFTFFADEARKPSTNRSHFLLEHIKKTKYVGMYGK